MSQFHVEHVAHARLFAIAAHRANNHHRKYTGERYEVHLYEVADIVTSINGTTEMLQAAWLHDTVEDTGITHDDILEVFGPTVRDYVFWLTDDLTPEDGNRKFRKDAARARLAQAPAQVHTIKCADLISNTKSIVEHDPSFAKVYLQEKRDLLRVMKSGNNYLWTRAAIQCGLIERSSSALL